MRPCSNVSKPRHAAVNQVFALPAPIQTPAHHHFSGLHHHFRLLGFLLPLPLQKRWLTRCRHNLCVRFLRRFFHRNGLDHRNRLIRRNIGQRNHGFHNHRHVWILAAAL
jgi:hypothetical protein